LLVVSVVAVFVDAVVEPFLHFIANSELSVQNPPNFGYQYSCQPDKRRDGDLDRLEAERPASAQEFLKSVVPRSERFTQCRWDVA